MVDSDRQKENKGKHGFAASINFVSILAQIVVFLIAAAAISLFYLTYRHGDFLQTIIVVGMILTGPWLFISLIPVLFVLDDIELKKEIITIQLVTMLGVLIILFGIAVYIDFHWVIIEQVVRYCRTTAESLEEIWKLFASYVKTAITSLKAFWNETLSPFFSNFMS